MFCPSRTALVLVCVLTKVRAGAKPKSAVRNDTVAELVRAESRSAPKDVGVVGVNPTGRSGSSQSTTATNLPSGRLVKR